MATTKIRCIVLVMGIPGVGKTTVAKALLEDKTFKHVEFDALYNEDAQEGFDPQRWKRTREKMRAVVSSMLSDPAASGTVIVDDNFQYRSMRLQYARLAAECSAAFCTLYLRCDDPSLAKRMNKSRTGAARVPEAVIDAMSAVLEPPDPTRYLWEENVYVVDVEEKRRAEGLEECVQGIRSWLKSVSGSVVVLTKKSEIPEYLREQSREANTKSEKHQFDLWSRKVVASVVSSASPDAKGPAAGVCAALRKKYLSGVSFGDETKSEFLCELTKLNINQN